MPIQKKKKGFTLTEVLVVVLIIGVLSAVAYPVYTKAINKSRAIEAMNLLEMVRNKQISNYARKGAYLQDFSGMGQLTSNLGRETVAGNKMSVGKYELAIYPEGSCMTSAYVPAKNKAPIFTFSSGYEEAGLGCEGSICATFGNIVGGKESVCNCGDKKCGLNFNMDSVSCACSCPLECNQNNLCYDKTQTQATTQACGYNNSGTQARTCTASCDSGSCGEWSACSGQSCNTATKPTTTQACASGCGTQSRTVTCNNGSWNTGSWSGTCTSPTQTQATTQSCGSGGTQTRTCTANCSGGTCGAWGSCTGQTCSESTKPAASQICSSGCGTQTRTVTCDNGTWNAGSWSGSCSSPTQTQATSQSCGNGGTQTRTCTASCEGGTCGEWGACTGEVKECASGSKPAETEACGNCGTKTRTVSCDVTTGTWTSGAWGTCTGAGVCSAGTTQSCGNGGTQTCSDACSWGTCTGEVKECASSSKPAETEACGNCGTKTRTVSCDATTGTWTSGAWGTCTGAGVCSAGTTQSCGNGGTQTCSDACSWGTCTGETATCDPATKPNIDSNCGCGKLKFTYECDTATLTWRVAGTECVNTHSCADPNQTRPCGGGNGVQKCGSTCEWDTAESCICKSGYIWNGSTCIAAECTPGETQNLIPSCAYGVLGTKKCNALGKWEIICPANSQWNTTYSSCVQRHLVGHEIKSYIFGLGSINPVCSAQGCLSAAPGQNTPCTGTPSCAANAVERVNYNCTVYPYTVKSFKETTYNPQTGLGGTCDCTFEVFNVGCSYDPNRNY